MQQRVLDGQLAGQHVRRVLVEHSVGDPGIGQHFGHWLVQVVGHARGQFTEGVEPGHLTQAKQFMGALPIGALAQQRPRCEQQDGHEQ